MDTKQTLTEPRQPGLDTKRIFEREQNQLHFRAGEAIFRRGDQGETAFVLLEGEVRLMSGEVELERVAEGGIFGEMVLIEHEPRSADAVAHTDCRVAVLEQRRFLYLVQQTPHFGLHVMRLLARRLRETTSHIARDDKGS